MSFSTSLKTLCDLEEDKLYRTARAVVIALFTEIIERTPFLTGRLASNWRCSMTSPMVGTVGIAGKVRWNDKGSGPMVVGNKGSVRREAINGMVKVAMTISSDFVIWLVNNLPYARRIEYEGWSHTKAPSGMVGISMARVHTLVEMKIREIQSSRLQEGFLK